VLPGAPPCPKPPPVDVIVEKTEGVPSVPVDDVLTPKEPPPPTVIG
jgi:hypothetical protein